MSIGDGSSIGFISGVVGIRCGYFRPNAGSEDGFATSAVNSDVITSDIVGAFAKVRCDEFRWVISNDGIGDHGSNVVIGNFVSNIAKIRFDRFRHRFLGCDALRGVRRLELQRKPLFLFRIFGNGLLHILPDGLACGQLRNCSDAGLGKANAADASLELAGLAKAQNGNSQLSGLFPRKRRAQEGEIVRAAR